MAQRQQAMKKVRRTREGAEREMHPGRFRNGGLAPLPRPVSQLTGSETRERSNIMLRTGERSRKLTMSKHDYTEGQ